MLLFPITPVAYVMPQLLFYLKALMLAYLYFLLFSSNAANANSSLKLSDIKDENLASCILKNATKMHLEIVEELTHLKCHGMNITNLEGLEMLINLEKLSLFNNSLTHADLRPFKKLKHLNVANNKLVNINIVGLLHLESLYLFKNKLVTVDFKGLSQLKKIRITNNKLKILDISALLSLEKAYFFDNKLEELVVAGLPNIKFIELRQNPMPDEVYDRYDALEGITIIHDGNADDWK